MDSSTDRTPVIAVVGPTASGKSDLAVEIALAVGGEVVNADAMALYRGLDIGTAKISLTERRGVPHHQLDVLDPGQEASVAAYQRHARADLAAIRARGRRPILAGGSGLYLRAVVDELEIPPTDPEVRAAVERELSEVGVAVLHRRLTDRDPAAAAAIEPGNARRVVRALEVIALTGRPFSATLPQPVYHRPAVQLGLRLDREVLDRRIARRVDRMWAAGFVDEVRALRVAGLEQGRTASRALGYAQVLEFLSGRLTEAEAKEHTVQATRRFARRQESWWRRDDRIVWLPAGTPGLLERALTVLESATS